MKQKNLGIELLRIIAMFMVVLMHINAYGGLLGSMSKSDANYWVVYFIQCASFCCVNCFAMISGYLLYNREEKASRILNIYLQTIFYTITIIGVYAIFKTEYRSMKMLLATVFPVMRKTYWYVSAYIGVCILMPVLNKALYATGKKTMGMFLLTSFLFFSVLRTFLGFDEDPFTLNDGLSMFWLCWMYLWGGYFKKYDIVEKVRSSTAWLTYVIAIVATFASELVFVFGGEAVFGAPMFAGIMLSYTSPTIVIAAVALFVACAKMKIGKKMGKVVQAFGKAAFGVYLIHLCPPIWQSVIHDCAKDFASHNVIIMVGIIFLTAIAIYLSCSAVEFIRIGLFKLCRIDRLGNRLDNNISRRIEKCKLFANASEEIECNKN